MRLIIICVKNGSLIKNPSGLCLENALFSIGLGRDGLQWVGNVGRWHCVRIVFASLHEAMMGYNARQWGRDTR